MFIYYGKNMIYKIFYLCFKYMYVIINNVIYGDVFGFDSNPEV